MVTFEDPKMMESNDNATVSIKRPAYTQARFDEIYQINKEGPEDSDKAIRNWFKRKYTCSPAKAKKFFLDLFPFINIMRGYKPKQWLHRDVIAGLNIGVIAIPQGMGFALLTQVPPVYGLYTSIWPPLLYFLFGTSRHINVGAMALISIMIGSVVQTQATQMGYVGGGDALNGTQAVNETVVEDFKVGIALSVTLIMGVVQIIMYILRLGIIAKFMSMPFVSAFMTGAGINIMVSQLPALFQVTVPLRPNMFKTIMTVVDFFSNIASTNVASMITGLVCFAVLFVLKEVINDRYKDKMAIPIPAELIVVIIGTIIAHFAKFNERWGVRVVGDIPSGIPAPSVPSMHNWTEYIGDAVIIGIIGYAVNITMAKLMSKKHGYKVDCNQELLASGVSFGVGAFFHAFGGAQGPPRTVVHDISGGKTQVAGIVASLLVLIICLFATSLFRDLPNSVLAAIIIVALIPLLKSFKELKGTWKVNRYDAVVWIATIACVVIFDITIGLLVGLVLSSLMVTIQGLLTRGDLMAEVDGTAIYTAYPAANPEVQQTPGIRIFKFNGSVYFVNADRFKKQLFKHTVKPVKVVATKEKIDVITTTSSVEKLQSPVTEHGDIDLGLDLSNGFGPDGIRTIILDLSQVSYIDIMGLNMIKQLMSDYDKVGVKLVFACCSERLIHKLAACGLAMENDSLVFIYPTVRDAITSNINTGNDNNDDDSDQMSTL